MTTYELIQRKRAGLNKPSKVIKEIKNFLTGSSLRPNSLSQLQEMAPSHSQTQAKKAGPKNKCCWFFHRNSVKINPKDNHESSNLPPDHQSPILFVKKHKNNWKHSQNLAELQEIQKSSSSFDSSDQHTSSFGIVQLINNCANDDVYEPSMKQAIQQRPNNSLPVRNLSTFAIPNQRVKRHTPSPARNRSCSPARIPTLRNQQIRNFQIMNADGKIRKNRIISTPYEHENMNSGISMKIREMENNSRNSSRSATPVIQIMEKELPPKVIDSMNPDL